MFEFLLWKDHAVSPSNTYKLTKNNDDTYTLTPVGKVIQQGTNMSAANFNRMEVGLHRGEDRADHHSAARSPC